MRVAHQKSGEIVCKYRPAITWKRKREESRLSCAHNLLDNSQTHKLAEVMTGREMFLHGTTTDLALGN